MTRDTLAHSAQEREEWQCFLASHILTRAPSVLRVAEYIGRKYFEGDAANLKEYNIAVEALGKPVDFDPKRDSIVRVEAHRLRKKLHEFYRTEGCHRPMRAIIDPGRYVPRFEAVISPPEIDVSPESQPTFDSQLPFQQASLQQLESKHVAPLAPPSPPLLPPPPKPTATRARLFPAALLAAVVLLGAFLLHRHRSAADASLLNDTRAIRILCGGPQAAMLFSEDGESWAPDHYFTGGVGLFGGSSGIPIPQQAAANTQRQGDFRYDIPLVRRPYELRLYFGIRMLANTPTVRDPVSTRRFDVLLNGRKIIDALDPAALSRQSSWSVRVFRDVYPAPDHLLHLAFQSAADRAFVSAIEITPGLPGRLRPIRLISKAALYQDRSGQSWQADRYAIGGKLVARTGTFAPGIDPNLLSGERFGAFSYDIPVPRGSYRLRLYFAESWFNPQIGHGGLGSRRFDVYANSNPLLQDFDILHEAGQSYHGIIKEFRNLQPDRDGYINLQFVPRINYACLNALELLDESETNSTGTP